MQRSIIHEFKNKSGSKSTLLLKLAVRNLDVKESISQVVALLGGVKLQDNLEVLLVLLSPHALLCALHAGLLLRAQLFERTLVFFILAFLLDGNIIVKTVELFSLFD